MSGVAFRDMRLRMIGIVGYAVLFPAVRSFPAHELSVAYSGCLQSSGTAPVMPRVSARLADILLFVHSG
jgi:hypothetical protein